MQEIIKNTKKLNIRTTAFVLAASSMLTLSGCISDELAPQEVYDVISTENNDDSLSGGLKQVLDIPGRDFKLVTLYSCDDSSKREWRITSDKFLSLEVYTQGLPENTEVYIDNVHIDTSIKSKYAVMDGILQDSMDDHVHSSQLIGFPISENQSYYGVNAIEGSNEEFIQNTVYGYNGYYSSSNSSIRYTESIYMELGVYANKIQIVYDLLIKGPNDKDYSNVSVSTEFIVLVTNAKLEQEDIKTYSK